MTGPRTQEIAATAGELHHFLTAVTPEWTDYLRGRLNPKAPYECRALAAGLRAAVAKKITWEQFGQFVVRLLDADYGKGTNSFRPQLELGELLERSESTVRRADAAIRGAGLATRKLSRRGSAIFTMIAPQELDWAFKELGGHIDPRPQERHADAGVNVEWNIEIEGEAARGTSQRLSPQDRSLTMTGQVAQDRSSAMTGQNDLRPGTQYDSSKIKTGQIAHLRPVTLRDRQPYYLPKKKEARAQPHGRERQEPNVIGSAFLSWILRGDRGWSDGYRAAFGETPGSEDSRIYRHSESTLRRGFEYVSKECRNNMQDPAIRTRAEVIARRIGGT
jgi:hypothetical protein